MECEICYETVAENDIEILECAHGLCKKCFSLLRTRNCPFCRTIIRRISAPIAPVNSFVEQIVPENDYSYDGLAYESMIIESVRFRRRRRRNYEERQRTRQQSHANIPTTISDIELNHIMDHVSTSPIITSQKHHTSDKNRQKYRHNRNKWKTHLVNY